MRSQSKGLLPNWPIYKISSILPVSNRGDNTNKACELYFLVIC